MWFFQIIRCVRLSVSCPVSVSISVLHIEATLTILSHILNYMYILCLINFNGILLGLCASWCRIRIMSDTYDYIEVCYFLKLLSMSVPEFVLHRWKVSVSRVFSSWTMFLLHSSWFIIGISWNSGIVVLSYRINLVEQRLEQSWFLGVRGRYRI